MLVLMYNPEDLDALEVVVLGVLCVGLPPSRAAGSDTFRMDHVAAVVYGLERGEGATAFVGPDGVHVSSAFREELKGAIASLGEKGLVTPQQGDGPAAAGGFEAGLAIDIVNPDEHPAVLDRYLAQLCMEQLFKLPDVYPFLMERYSASGEVWRRLREAGYQR